MFGLFGRFGRSWELRELDRAMRAVDLHPALVPDAVELAAVRLLRQEAGRVDAAGCAAAAELMAYCLIGAEAFAGANGEAMTVEAEARIERAVEAGDDIDARLVLLLLHAGLVQPSVVSRFSLEAVSRT